MLRHHVIIDSLTVENALVRCLIIAVLFLSIIYGKTKFWLKLSVIIQFM